MNEIFTTEQLAKLSAQVDEQLRELSQKSDEYTRGITKGDTQLFSAPQPDDDLPHRQRQAIEESTKKQAGSFLQEFADKAKEMLCDADSDLRKEYEQFGGLDKVSLLERLAALLAVMGFSGIGLQVLTIAITVYIIHIGLKPFADKYCQ
jgi:hypothetical protein